MVFKEPLVEVRGFMGWNFHNVRCFNRPEQPNICTDSKDGWYLMFQKQAEKCHYWQLSPPQDWVGWLYEWERQTVAPPSHHYHTHWMTVLSPCVCSDRRWIFIYYMPMKTCFRDTLLCVFYFLSHQSWDKGFPIGCNANRWWPLSPNLKHFTPVFPFKAIL